jgi:hypothetical protein
MTIMRAAFLALARLSQAIALPLGSADWPSLGMSSGSAKGGVHLHQLRVLKAIVREQYLYGMFGI